METDSGISSIDSSIERLENKIENLKNLKRNLNSLEEKAEVIVNNPKDGPEIEVIITANEPYQELIKIANMDRFFHGESIRNEYIDYEPEKEIYKVKKTFKTNR